MGSFKIHSFQVVKAIPFPQQKRNITIVLPDYGVVKGSI